MQKDLLEAIGKMLDEKLDKKLDEKLDEKLKPIFIEIAGMKSEINGIKTEINGMKSEISGIKTEITGIKTEINGMKSEMKGMRSTLDEHTLILRALEHSAEVNKAEHNCMMHDIAEIKGDVVSIKKDILLIEEVTAKNWSDINQIKRESLKHVDSL